MQGVVIGIGVLLVIFIVGSSIFNWIAESIDNYAKELARARALEKWQKNHDKWTESKNSYLEKISQEQNKTKTEQKKAHENKILAWKKECERLESTWEEEISQKISEWEATKKKIKNDHERISKDIRKLKSAYFNKDTDALEKYVELILEQNHKHFGFTSENSSKFIPDNNTLVVDCKLPAPDDIPILKEVRYIKTRNITKEMHLTQTVLNKLYDETIYQLCLSNVNQIFLTDEIKKIEAVIFNGWVHTVDKSTGQKIKACILSLQVSKEKFSEINLKRVDPKECFRYLKGIGSSKLYGITPIPPIMRVNKDDKRFIESYDVAHTLNEGINIAAMDWQDFEHLVREIFQKMFSTDGMEVKVTQSSRDKGVDAIAIDPDPVRGGKIVIQAKRYTNVVSVSSVRDLYGTVMNEGAMKGILVTTSNFGNDAYDFVKDKPLTLISGGELLSLLSENGYQARIKLKDLRNPN